MGRASKDKRDVFYRKAKEEGYRARSAFKLLQIDHQFNIFDGVKNVVDLCAAPGSWSQVCSQKLKDVPEAHIVAIDLNEMLPIPGVTILKGDITSPQKIQEIIDACEGKPIDIVLSDGAPDVTGLHDMDEYLQGQLILAALTVTTKLLRPGGKFVAKIFRGKDVAFMYTQLRVYFCDVVVAKPQSSRNSSIESFVVCRGFRQPESYSHPLLEPFTPSADKRSLIKDVRSSSSSSATPSSSSSPSDSTEMKDGKTDSKDLKEAAAEEEGKDKQKKQEESGKDEHSKSDEAKEEKAPYPIWHPPSPSMLVPFVSCGDLSGFDSDQTYPLDLECYKLLAPVAPPIHPPYEKALQEIHNSL
ncbi:putative S-adenosyl-L-methionine-dependent methyltransferases superfamily protein [Monocercomonoides exilis]|uniref:putative S-adenosyl-L-methionine-dependent methyltransferases superfamily protein n=1 Tax=Monocercomonoides exilis TaxID=2049356 RepID=UPI00355A0119|nr:putative S-adenosyl-L-methionine-dependent methyltransferases superfamily protein [Monocercomonoides exilis]|eukprot:MONOS_14589.1-p1 / transcript=MONOS_14589.1 / gene=MONOS_14589 / organism=Monocercomonoides_exilis_PA203 / gene_product=tRNA / transcript_product=tRNA / location=Mono_scaffold01029:4869-6592(+) / protein_length=356 / sequence_SO=supercontig / SO=protein_coding / is_pseudo=false